MKRRELRQHIFEMLFRVEFHSPEELEGQLILLLQGLKEDQEVTAEDEAYILEKCRGILGVLPALDLAVDKAAQGWKTSRIGKVELAILRLAVYEMRYDPDVPVSVAINEAVELAKEYGQEDSPAFINGILGKAAKSDGESEAAQEEERGQEASRETAGGGSAEAAGIPGKAAGRPRAAAGTQAGAGKKKKIYITKHPERSSQRGERDGK